MRLCQDEHHLLLHTDFLQSAMQTVLWLWNREELSSVEHTTSSWKRRADIISCILVRAYQRREHIELEMARSKNS